MKKKISAKILITQLVILCITLFIFPMKLKADDVSYPFFLYNVRHTYEEDNSLVHPFRHKYEFYIHANHEVTGRFIISITTGSGTTSHTWYCESGGEIYNNQIMDRSTGTTVLVTGQQYLKVTLMFMSDSPIDIMNVRSIQFSQTDLDGNIITTDQSLWSEVQKIEDHTFQLLSAVGFINDNLADVRTKLQSVITLMNTTNTKLDTLISTATNILTKVTSIDTAVQQIDNTIDTISYIDYNTTINKDPNITTNWTDIGSEVSISFGSTVTASDRIIKLQLPICVKNSAGREIDVEFWLNGTKMNYINYYITNNQNMNNLYFYGDIPSSNLIIKLICNNGTLRTGNITSVPYKVSYIPSSDIEYWELLSYINQYNFYKQQLKDNKSILDKLSELILGNTTTNNSVSNNDSSNQQFQQQTQQYDEIESTFQSSFSTDQQAIQQTFSTNSLTMFADTALWFTRQLNKLFVASGDLQILFTMPLLLGLALFFIGRGAKTSAPNTIERYYSSEVTGDYDGIRYYRVRQTSGVHKVLHGFNRKK